ARLFARRPRQAYQQRLGMVGHPVEIVGGAMERHPRQAVPELIGTRAQLLGAQTPSPYLPALLVQCRVFLFQKLLDNPPCPLVRQGGEQALVALDISPAEEWVHSCGVSFKLVGDLREARCVAGE